MDDTVEFKKYFRDNKEVDWSEYKAIRPQDTLYTDKLISLR